MKNITIGKVRGYDYTAKISEYMDWQILEAKNEEHLVALLEGGRIDVAIIDFFYGPILVEQKQASIRALTPAMDSTPLYLDFNHKHRELVSKLEPILLEMLGEGFFDSVYHKYLGQSYTEIKQHSGF